MMKKGIVCIIFVLFLGISLVPSVGSLSSDNHLKKFNLGNATAPLEVKLEWNIWYDGDVWSVVFIANCSDESGIDRVEFLLDNVSQFITFWEPYEWYVDPLLMWWVEKGIVCAVAYNLYGDSASDCINWSQPPSTPIINGPASGKVGVEYTYTFNSTDLVGNYCNCTVDWGDGIIGRVGHTESGPGIANHSWKTKGTYIIKAESIDIHGTWSEWGELTVTIPKNKVIDNSLFLRFIERFPLLERMLNLINKI